MGREIKRVPVGWDWPLEKIWEGYVNPLASDWPPCPDCSYPRGENLIEHMFGTGRPRGSGLTPEAYAIQESFYSHQIDTIVTGGGRFGVSEGAKQLAWHDKLGQAEVDNLVAEGRLREWKDGKWESVPRTAAEVNASQHNGSGISGLGGHDAINRWILVEFRCKVLGIELSCPTCKGHGDIATDEQRDAYENWERTEPPTGEGWQVWETVSEGSPITPVFPTAEELVDYLATKGTTWDQKPSAFGGDRGPWRREAAESFVKSGFAMSFTTIVGEDGKGLLLQGGRDDDVADAIAARKGAVDDP